MSFHEAPSALKSTLSEMIAPSINCNLSFGAVLCKHQPKDLSAADAGRFHRLVAPVLVPVTGDSGPIHSWFWNKRQHSNDGCPLGVSSFAGSSEDWWKFEELSRVAMETLRSSPNGPSEPAHNPQAHSFAYLVAEVMSARFGSQIAAKKLEISELPNGAWCIQCPLPLRGPYPSRIDVSDNASRGVAEHLLANHVFLCPRINIFRLAYRFCDTLVASNPSEPADAPRSTSSLPYGSVASLPSNGDWLQPPCSKSEMGRRVGMNPKEFAKAFRDCDIRPCGTRQLWTIDLNGIKSKKFRHALEKRSV